MDASRAVDALQPIGLDDLNTAAALQTRTDRKYIVDDDTAALLLTELSDELVVLEIAGERSFGYSSVYFDTESFELHRAAATGRRRRFKVRTRVYEDSGRSMLEVKTKDGRGRTVKDRLDYDQRDRSVLTPVGLAFIEDVLDRVGVSNVDTPLAPVLRTSYRRSTVFHHASTTRATIDTEVLCRSLDDRTVGCDGVIIETKSDVSAGPLDRWLWDHGARPVRVSKFCTGLVALHPDLPSNKWNRTLTRHFS